MENLIRVVQPIGSGLMNQQSTFKREAMGKRKTSEKPCLFADILIREINKQRSGSKR